MHLVNIFIFKDCFSDCIYYFYSLLCKRTERSFYRRLLISLFRAWQVVLELYSP